MKRLEDYLKEQLGRGKTRLEVYRVLTGGGARLVDPEPPASFYEYLSRPDYSLWLWTGYALVAIAVLVFTASSPSPPLLYARYLLGALVALFLPGYYTVEALYPEPGSLKDVERLALSLGVSLAVLPLLGLLLNYTPFGVRPWPVVVTVSGYILATGLLAAYRKYQVQRGRSSNRVFIVGPGAAPENRNSA